MSMDEELSVRHQCRLLRVSRSCLYYQAVEVGADELTIMAEIDKLHLKYPFYGSRKISHCLRAGGLVVNRKRVQRLMRKMGVESVAPKPNTSKPAPEHKVYPYLLRNLRITTVNRVWAADITYIPMARGFGYLVAIIDWYSRRVLAWRLSNTMDQSFCVEALEEATRRGVRSWCRSPSRMRAHRLWSRRRLWPLHWVAAGRGRRFCCGCSAWTDGAVRIVGSG